MTSSSASPRPPARSSAPTCRHCGRPIRHRRNLLLLRSRQWIPEDPSVVLLHQSCAEAFEETHEDTWNRYDRSSPEAIWLLPLRS